VTTSDQNSSEQSAAPGYRRSAGSARGEARRRELLDRVTDDLVANGLVDFSLRRAARAAGATHKVLLYYFDGAEDLLVQAVAKLRQRRIDNATALTLESYGTLAERVRALWPTLTEEEPGLRRVLDQAMGLAQYDSGRYGELGRQASRQYLPMLRSLCPDGWSERRKDETAAMILATLRGFLLERLVSGDEGGVQGGFEALIRALEREEGAAVD